jgi:ribose 5-phosphate isomerase
MDPVVALDTAAALVKVVKAVSTTLFLFIQDTRQVDQSLNSFYVEVTVLQTAIKSIAGSLQSSSVRTASSSRDLVEMELWGSVDDSLHECGKTCEELARVLANIRGDHGSSVFGQTIKQVKLNLETENIHLLRSKVQIHSTSLQLALQVINV